MRPNIAVIYTGDLQQVATAFGEAAAHMSARVRLRRVSEYENDASAGLQANFEDLH